MNLKRIRNILVSFSDILENDLPTDEELLIVVGNILRAYSSKVIASDERLADLDINDAAAISLLSAQYPDSAALALLLQSHVIIKLSEQFRDE